MPYSSVLYLYRMNVKAKKPGNVSPSNPDTNTIVSSQNIELLDKACATILKPQLQASFKTLFNAVKPLYAKTFTAAPVISDKPHTLTAASDAEWLRSIEQKLEALSSVPSSPSLPDSFISKIECTMKIID